MPQYLVEELGGKGPILHLAHANGFPPGTYRGLAIHLARHFRVYALAMRPLWPGCDPESTPTWRPLCRDMIRAFDALGWRGIVGIGHSLGGVVTLWAAIERPDLFRAIVLIEPVILPARWLVALRLQRVLGLAGRQPLVQRAQRRRRNWPSRDACYEYMRGRVLFRNWPPDAVEAYVDAGTRELADGTVELAYPAEWEAHIFATVPTDIWRDVPRLRVPALVVRGERSTTFLAASQRRMARLLPASEHAVISGAGHLVPMERPELLCRTMSRYFRDQSIF